MSPNPSEFRVSHSKLLFLTFVMYEAAFLLLFLKLSGEFIALRDLHSPTHSIVYP